MIRYVPLLLALAPAAADAGFPGERFHESLVIGANLVVALGSDLEASRFGAGVDVWYQVQWYSQSSARIDGTFTVWAVEHPAWTYGPAAHVWWRAGAWHSSLGARFGVNHPLRVGLGGGWWPGPGLAMEVGGALSTAGYVSLDTHLVAELPWAQARLALSFNTTGVVDPRVHLGAFVPLVQAHNWEGVTGDVWHRPD